MIRTLIWDARGREYGRFYVERLNGVINVSWVPADEEDCENGYGMAFQAEQDFENWRKQCTAVGPEIKVWYVVGPDGLTDVADGEYHTRGEAEAAMTRFLRRFERQGYYKTADGVRMGMAELASETKVTREAP